MRGTLVLAVALLVPGCSKPTEPAGDDEPEPEAAPVWVEAALTRCVAPLYQYRVPSAQSGVPAEWEPLGATPITTSVFLQAFFCAEGRLGDEPLGPVFFAVLAGDSANAPEPPETGAQFWFWGYGILALTDSPALLAYLQEGGMTAEPATAGSTDGPLPGLTIDGSGWSIEGECSDLQAPGTRLVAELFLYHGPRADPILLAVRTEGINDNIEAGTLRASSGLAGAQLAPTGVTPSTCSTSSYDVLARFLAAPK